MDAQFERRKQELLQECDFASEIFEQVVPRLEDFMEPFVASFVRREQVEHAQTFVEGLLSDLDHKNVESIAYRYDQGRMPLQWFIGYSAWDDQPLRNELVQQVGEQLGDSDAVLVIDPSAFPKSGTESVGVARQWCGRLGKVDNCQVAVYLGYVSRLGHTLVDTRLYLPEEWTNDTSRMRKAHVPKERRRHRTRHKLALDMLLQNRARLPHAWIAGDDEMGRPFAFRRDLHELGERYLLAVPSNICIRDMEVDEPSCSGRGRPRVRPWQRVDRWLASQPKTAWKEIEVRDGAKGPLVVRILKRCVLARNAKRKPGHPEILVVIRRTDRDQINVVKTDYYLSNALPQTELREFACVATAEHRIEECLQCGKSEVGLADYEVRNWTGWHHHQILSFIALWFLVTQTKRGKKTDTSHYAATTPRRHRNDSPSRQSMWDTGPNSSRTRTTSHSKRTRTPISLETT
jgi:SRSO17 transposase